MSRSFKKPWITDNGACRRFFKNYANRTIRRKSYEFDIANGCSYKKHFDQYSICDYKFSYNPHPWVYYSYRTGVPEWVQPDPIYKYNRK
jgi:hypothetical protein